MTREKAQRVLIPAVVCAALLGALLVLTANLENVPLGPGELSPKTDSADGPQETDSRGSRGEGCPGRSRRSLVSPGYVRVDDNYFADVRGLPGGRLAGLSIRPGPISIGRGGVVESG